MVVLSSTKAEYISLTVVAKEVIWLRIFLTELGLVKRDKQYIMMNVKESNSNVNALLESILVQGEKDSGREQQPRKVNKKYQTTRGKSNLIVLILLKGDNKGPIAIVHNPIFHFRTKHINI